MYTLAGLDFYEESDGNDIIVDAYAKACVLRNAKQLGGVPLEEVIKTMNEIQGTNFPVQDYNFFKAMAENMLDTYNNSKAGMCHIINKINSEDMIKDHEQHWLQLLKGMGFDSNIISYETGIACIIGTSMLHLTSENKIMNMLYHLDEHKYLSISLVSSITNNDGDNLVLNDLFIKHFIKNFIGSYTSGDKLFIRYGPAEDVKAVLSVTMYLHMFL